jgi:hypothetical protein
MKNWIQRMMAGRYGVDQLSNAIFIMSIIVILASILLESSILNTVGIVMLIVGYMRMFSRNINSRYTENQKFMNFYKSIFGKYKGYNSQLGSMWKYKYFKCPNCNQRLRVPKGKGRLNVKCPKCKNSFVRRT